MNNTNSTLHKIYYIFTFVIMVILILLIIYYLINNTNYIYKHQKGLKIYNIQSISKGYNSKNMLKCKEGCSRGICQNRDTENGCKYDYQCNYCIDENTDKFYVNFTGYKKLLPEYDIQNKLSKNQKNNLNYEIEENNEYIDNLNEQINEYNNEL